MKESSQTIRKWVIVGIGVLITLPALWPSYLSETVPNSELKDLTVVMRTGPQEMKGKRAPSYIVFRTKEYACTFKIVTPSVQVERKKPVFFRPNDTLNICIQTWKLPKLQDPEEIVPVFQIGTPTEWLYDQYNFQTYSSNEFEGSIFLILSGLLIILYGFRLYRAWLLVVLLLIAGAVSFVYSLLGMWK